MGISPVTRIINFLITSLKKNEYLERGIIEYKIPLPNGSTAPPDFLTYLINKKRPTQKNYIAFEIKQRSLDTRDGEAKTTIGRQDIERIKDQYTRLSSLSPDSFDPNIFSRVVEAPIYLDYIFYHTPEEVLDEIKSEIPFRDNDAILYHAKRDGIQERIHYYQKPSLNQHNEIIDLLIADSKIGRYWSNLFIPFLLQDLEGIRGMGGDPLDVKIDSSVSVNIILAQLFSFIEQKKVREEDSEFDMDDFLDFVFSSLKGLVRIDHDERTAIKRRLRNFLNHVIKTCNNSNFALIKGKNVNKYQIIVRKTENLSSRLEKLQSDLAQLIDETRKQSKLDDHIS